MNLTAGTRRLFANSPIERLDGAVHEPLIIERLLEDGDGDDLRWLTGTVPEARLELWARDRAVRRLSRRSRAFWEIVLGVDVGTRPAAVDDLWPL